MSEKAQASTLTSANDDGEIPELETAENPDIETLFADEVSNKKLEETNEQNDKKVEQKTPETSDSIKDSVEEELIEIKINANSKASSIFSNPCVNKNAGKLKVILAMLIKLNIIEFSII